MFVFGADAMTFTIHASKNGQSVMTIFELAGDSQNERLQVRTIAFGIPGSPRDAVRDRDMETIWCDELDRLKTLLARSGGSLEIEKALPVGTPLKVVEDSLATGAVDDARTIRSRESQ